jgi:hemoglobin-like flavoprotein
MKEVTVEEIKELVATTVRDVLNKHHIGEVTPEGKELIKQKTLEAIEDLASKGIITIVPDKEPDPQ